MGKKNYKKFKKKESVGAVKGGWEPSDYGGKVIDDDAVIEIDEMQDIIKSAGGFDKQVKKEKESGTNSYAKDNQKTIKKLKA